MYNYSEWKNYKNVPRFVKEYARWKINNLTDNKYLNAEWVDNTIGRIFDTVKRLEYGFISIDECVSVIECGAFNADTDNEEE